MDEKELRREDGSGREESASNLDLWMLKWLQLRRQDLVAGIQCIVLDILDYLVQKGHVNPLRSALYQEIMSGSIVPVQKARKLLDWLSTQPPTVFWAFQRAMRESSGAAVPQLLVTEREMKEMMDLVDVLSLSDKLRLSYGGAVFKVREELQSWYGSMDELRLSAGFAKGRTLPMEQVTVNVRLLSEEDTRAAFADPQSPSTRSCFNDEQIRSSYLFSTLLQSPTSLLSLDMLYKQGGGESEDKTLAIGGAGCGKTVCFTRKAPYEWALGRLWTKVALLFCLDLRDKSVWDAKTVPELLKFSELGLDSGEQAEVLQFIKMHPREVVLVCDGLDEAIIDHDSLLWRVLTCACLSVPAKVRVVVASRPCEAADTMVDQCVSNARAYRKVEVIGFTQEDVEVFTQTYLGQVNGAQLLAEVALKPHISALMHAPLFNLLICDIFQETQGLPNRKTDVLEKLVMGLLRRFSRSLWVKRKRFVRTKFYSLSEAPAKVKKLVLALGKLALSGLAQRLCFFTSADLESAAVSAEALELGLLTKSEGEQFWKSDKYSFSHLTLQEFLAALYASDEMINCKENDCVAVLVQRIGFATHLHTFWEFLAGLIFGKVDDLLYSVSYGNLNFAGVQLSFTNRGLKSGSAPADLEFGNCETKQFTGSRSCESCAEPLSAPAPCCEYSSPQRAPCSEQPSPASVLPLPNRRRRSPAQPMFAILQCSSSQAMCHGLARHTRRSSNMALPLRSLFLCRLYHESHYGRRGSPNSSVMAHLEQHGLQLQFCRLLVYDCAAACSVLQSHSRMISPLTVDLTGCLAGDAGMTQLMPGLLSCRSVLQLGYIVENARQSHTWQWASGHVRSRSEECM